MSHQQTTNARYRKQGPRWIRPFISAGWMVARGPTKGLIKKLFFRPRRYQMDEVEATLLAQADRGEFDVHGVAVRTAAWGAGPAVILAHGWNGAGIQLHHFISPLRDAGFRVVAVDAPSHGESAGEDTSYFAYSQTLIQLIETVKPVGIIGHSFGAAASINALHKTRTGIPAALFAPPLHLRELLLATFEENGVSGRIFQQIIAEYEAEFGFAMEGDNPWHLIGELDNPILLTHDEGDRMIPLAETKAVVAPLAHVTLRATTDLGHKKVLADPEAINAAVSFIKDHPPTR